jgi:5-(carboxyamino)imidazole ribonucleotide synthase
MSPAATETGRAPTGRGASARVGIIGAGQLARMTQQAAIKLGIELVPLAVSTSDPAAAVAGEKLIGSPDDLEALRALAADCDVVTLDHERVPHRHLAELEREGFALRPGAAAKRYAQDKLYARRALGEAGFPVPEFATTEDADDAAALAERWGGALVLKAIRGGYDGRGVLMLEAASLPGEFPREGEWFAEQRVPIERELSQLIVRGVDGETVAYPLVETVQRDGICIRTVSPARVPSATADACRDLATRLASHIGAVGVLAVELFLTPGGELVLNELALRPHNSGHFTIEGCETSQFENHLRAVLGWPLGATSLRAPAVVMANVLGSDGSDPAELLPDALRAGPVHPHIYGKEARDGRKLGHVTALGQTHEEAEAAATRGAEILAGGSRS